MNACIARRVSEAELGGDRNADPSDSFTAALLVLAGAESGEGGALVGTGGTGFSENTVSGFSSLRRHLGVIEIFIQAFQVLHDTLYPLLPGTES